jgi:hypothetical protein
MLSTNLSVVLSPPGHEIRMRLAQAHMAQRFPFLIGKRFGQMWSWNAGMTRLEGTLKTFWTGRESFALSSPPFSHSRLYLQHFFCFIPQRHCGSGSVHKPQQAQRSSLTYNLWLWVCGRMSANSCGDTPAPVHSISQRGYIKRTPCRRRVKAKPVP